MTRRLPLYVGLSVLVLAIQALLAVAPAPLARAQTALPDYPVPGGWFYSQDARQGSDAPPLRGYTVTDDADAAFWTEYRRFGGQPVLGYPVSQRYRYPFPDGALHQAFQRGILQWRADEGRARMSNIFEQFTEQGLDDALEIMGIPRPAPPTDLSYEDDVQRRMSWITEPRFLGRFLYDPVNQQAYEFQERAWEFFGLPQTPSERPVYYREKLNGKFGPPLYQTYIAQRFQKAGLQLFLEDQPLDPTIVPGDGKRGCVALTATGSLARRIGWGRIIPGIAISPQPVENPPKVRVSAIVPQLNTPTQRLITFELIGTGFDPGESVTIRLTPSNTISLGSGSDLTLGDILSPVVSRVDETTPDGSFDVLLTVRVGTYTVSLRGERSGKVLDPSVDPIINLNNPTVLTTTGVSAPFC